MLMDLEEAYLRKGGYELIFPLRSNVIHYEPFFEHKRYENGLVAAFLLTDADLRDRLFEPRHSRTHHDEV